MSAAAGYNANIVAQIQLVDWEPFVVYDDRCKHTILRHAVAGTSKLLSSDHQQWQ